MGHLDTQDMDICTLGDVKQTEKTYLIQSIKYLEFLPIATGPGLQLVESCPFGHCKSGLHLSLALENPTDAMLASFKLRWYHERARP